MNGVSAEQPRVVLLTMLDELLQAWAQGNERLLMTRLNVDVQFDSSAHGLVVGASPVANLLASDWPPHASVELNATNHHVAMEGRCAVLGSYVYGHVQVNAGKQHRLLFGAVLVAELRQDEHSWNWFRLHLTINWLEGGTALLGHWAQPRPKRLWQAGDGPAHLVNELDSPWARLPRAQVSGTPHEQIIDVFMRYIWAMDQADFALMRETLSDDIAGAFPPIGDLSSRHEVMGQLKSFRQAWPWMQHFCLPLHAEVDGNEASLIIGRVIAQQPKTSEGKPLFGAHYRLRLRRENSGWKIFWFEYIEGWVTHP